MICSKKLEFVLPYIDAAAKKYPAIKRKLVKIYKMPVSLENRCQSFGMLTSEDDKFYLGLRVRYQMFIFKKNGTIEVRIAPLSKIDVIETVAHELSHLISDFHHTPRRLKYQAILQKMFAAILEKEGYISEEDELK